MYFSSSDVWNHVSFLCLLTWFQMKCSVLLLSIRGEKALCTHQQYCWLLGYRHFFTVVSTTTYKFKTWFFYLSATRTAISSFEQIIIQLFLALFINIERLFTGEFWLLLRCIVMLIFFSATSEKTEIGKSSHFLTWDDFWKLDLTWLVLGFHNQVTSQVKKMDIITFFIRLILVLLKLASEIEASKKKYFNVLPISSSPMRIYSHFLTWEFFRWLDLTSDLTWLVKTSDLPISAGRYCQWPELRQRIPPRPTSKFKWSLNILGVNLWRSDPEFSQVLIFSGILRTTCKEQRIGDNV